MITKINSLGKEIFNFFAQITFYVRAHLCT